MIKIAAVLVSIASAIYIWQFGYGLYDQHQQEEARKSAEADAIIKAAEARDGDKRCKARWGYDYSFAGMSSAGKVTCCSSNPKICGELP